MNAIFTILGLQALLGAFDNLWHHELAARLPQRTSARHELALHAAREAIYGILFLGLAWCQWQGGFALLLAGLLLAELGITLADFLEEDRSRRLPPFERVLHTVLAISYGMFLALMAPQLWAWAQLPTALAPVHHGAVAWLFTAYALGVLAWSLRNILAVRHLGRQELGRLAQDGQAAAPAAPAAPHPPATVLVTGATGFVGSALLQELRGSGQRVIVLSRDLVQARALFGGQAWVVDRLDSIPSETRIDAIVNLAGASVLGLPWTAARRRQLLDSRVNVTAAVVKLMRRLQQRPGVLVSASAVGYYGKTGPLRPGAALDETGPPQPGQFQSDLCAAIEHEARRAEALGVRVVRLRLGVVLGRGGGAYPGLALAARLGLGATLGSGQQPAPWIHLHDAVGLIRFALAQPRLAGPVNAVAPDTRTQAAFTAALAKSFGRRAWLRVPYTPMRWALGEMAELLLEGQNVMPRAALAAGYQFRYQDLQEALRDLAT